MLHPRNTRIVAVNCRTGSLEISKNIQDIASNVNCRTGSLESHGWLTGLKEYVNCRTGSLEIAR